MCWQYTMQDLLDRIQASEVEIKDHLETIHACQIDGNITAEARFSSPSLM